MLIWSTVYTLSSKFRLVYGYISWSTFVNTQCYNLHHICSFKLCLSRVGGWISPVETHFQCCKIKCGGLYNLRPVGGGHGQQGKGFDHHQHAVTLFQHMGGLGLRMSLLIDITDQDGVLPRVLVKLQMLKQGHMGLVLLHRLSSNRVRVPA